MGRVSQRRAWVGRLRNREEVQIKVWCDHIHMVLSQATEADMQIQGQASEGPV